MTDVFTYNYEGIGAVCIPVKIDKTTDMDFTRVDLAAGRCAAVFSDSFEAGMGSAGDKLAGKIISLEDELDENGLYVRGTMQIGGCVKLKYTTTTPVINQMVEVDGAGLVRIATADTDIAAGGHLARGQVMAVDTVNSEVLVWL